MVGEMLADFNPDCKLQVNGDIMGVASIEYIIEGAGYGDLVSLIYKAITYKMQEDLVERIVQDYKDSQGAAAAEWTTTSNCLISTKLKVKLQKLQIHLIYHFNKSLIHFL